jgi:hypothetical protein
VPCVEAVEDVMSPGPLAGVVSPGRDHGVFGVALHTHDDDQMCCAQKEKRYERDVVLDE